VTIFILLAGHWSLAAFVQSSFHHRYASHRMFSLTPRAERLFHLFTYLVQGSSYLSPGAYAVLHREHHAYSDEPGDPHAPRFFSNVLTMMWATAQRYGAHVDRTSTPEPRFLGGYPDWPGLDGFASRWSVRIAWGTGYALLYVWLATAWWQFLLLPVHWVMAPSTGRSSTGAVTATVTGTTRRRTRRGTSYLSTSSCSASCSRTTTTAPPAG
jgi:stearoyl-CoA desaturase (delta-9 desaturase)